MPSPPKRLTLRDTWKREYIYIYKNRMEMSDTNVKLGLTEDRNICEDYTFEEFCDLIDKFLTDKCGDDENHCLNELLDLLGIEEVD